MPNSLGLADWTILTKQMVDGVNEVGATFDVRPEVCPLCGTVGQLQIWQRRAMRVRDVPNHGPKTVIVVDRIRFKCLSCEKTFMQPLPDVDERRRMTKRAIAYVREHCLAKPFVAIARDLGVDEKTVRQIAKEHMDAVTEYPVFAPFYLGIDEVMVGGELRAIFTDLANRQVLDLLEGRRTPSIVHWLSHLSHRERIHVVAIDMWAPYRDAARAVLGPRTRVVVDKFHVVRMADLGLDTVRKQVGQAQGVKGRRKLMRSRHVLLKRSANLSEQDALTLSGWIGNIPRLKEAYEAKEAFYAIYDTETRAEASNALEAWEKSLSDDMRVAFKPLLTAVGNWRGEILEFWDHRITNAYTEAMNGILKMINRTGRGYTFPVVRARILQRQSKPAKGWNVCEVCGVENGIDGGGVKAKYPMPLSARDLELGAKPMRMCMNCFRNHQSSWMSHERSPTTKSE